MSIFLLEEELLDKLNSNCRNRDDNGFCQWDSEHIQPGNQREYCLWLDYGGCHGFSTASHTELCESCEKLLTKCSIALLSWKVELLQMEIRGLKEKLIPAQVLSHSETEPDLSNSG
jgi:hypothetical protein